MGRQAFLFTCIVLLAAGVWTPVPARAQAQLVDRIAAVVDEEIITLTELQELIRYKGLTVPEDEREKRSLLRSMLDQAVNQWLVIQAARNTPDLRVEAAEVESYLEAYRRRFPDSETFRQHLDSIQLTPQELERILRRQLIVTKFVKLRFEPFVIVLPRQIQEYYETELVPQWREAGQSPPALDLLEEEIEEILTLRRTNQEMDEWVAQTKERTTVRILLFQKTGPPSLQP